MSTKNKSTLSGREITAEESISAKTLRTSIVELIQKDYPTFNENSFLSKDELNGYREKYISTYLSKEIHELTDLEAKVIKSISEDTLLSQSSTSEEFPLTFGQKIADKVATFGGSWTFIISFGVFIFIWICINIFWLINKGFDPYPFILLNLILSCLASMQAPVIMMSQNRKDEKDRIEAEKDYLINLKSELEIRALHEKIDHLILHQQQELMEIQKVQIEMMNDILKEVKK